MSAHVASYAREARTTIGRLIGGIMVKAEVGSLVGAGPTLLMPLWARAQEARRSDALLRDDKAVEIVDALDFDFDQMLRKRVPAADYCIRASIIDQMVLPHLERTPGRTVVEFGVGLDTRFDRLGHHAGRWIEVDLPDVIRLRRQFFAEGPRRTMIGSSVLDTDWMAKVAEAGKGPPLFVAEGMLYFLSNAEVRELFVRLADRFPGSAFIFDAQSPWFLLVSNLRHPLRTSKLRFTLGRNGTEIQRWDRRFHVQRYVGYGDSPYYDRVKSRLSWLKRLAAAAYPLTRHAFKIVEVGFE